MQSPFFTDRVTCCLLALACCSIGHAQLAADSPKAFGSVLDGRAGKLRPVPAGFLELFDRATSETAGKWGNVEAERDVMQWEALDEHYALTRANGLDFTLHALLWSEAEPAWAAGLGPDELRAEIEEWFAAAGERYPDVEFVDVVNEAPHGKTGSAAVVAALGGTGATGYDHVVEAYRLARRYFPASRLVLNDYDVLKRADYPEYDACAEALVAEGLLDVVGCQGHFLEGTSAGRIRDRLDHLAATTGLEILVSELELALVDDEAQRAKYEEIFPTIWEHPAVVGVNLWGYLEGNMWRDAGYLIRADGSDRPAMTWLREYLGGSYTRRLEAEAHDAQRGVVTYSAIVGYCDAGDYLLFADVDLEGARGMRLRFAKGSSQVGAVELRRGSADGTLLGTFPTYYTGSYDDYVVDGLDFAAPLAGRADLYIVFAGGRGVGNFDYFELYGAAGEPSPPGTEVIIYAAGRTNEERMRLEVDGLPVATWEDIGGEPFERVFVRHAYTHPEAGLAASRVRVAFDNDDGASRDLRVDAVELGGVRYEAEAPTTYSRGTWKSADGCAGGNKESEWLHCNGYFAFESGGGLRLGEPADRLSVSLSPNPATEAALVTWGRALQGDVTVADALGRAVYAETGLRAGASLPVRTWAPGTYVVRVRSGGAVGARQLIVR